MNIAERVERACEKAGLTQAKLAVRIGLSPSALSGALNGRHGLAPEHVGRIARVTRCTEIALAYCSDCPANVFGIRLLDGISQNPVAGLIKVLEELQEAADAALQLQRRLVNKESEADLNQADREAIEEREDQLIDVIEANMNTLAKLMDTYRRNPDEAVARHVAKCRQRGYLKRKSGDAA